MAWSVLFRWSKAVRMSLLKASRLACFFLLCDEATLKFCFFLCSPVVELKSRVLTNCASMPKIALCVFYFSFYYMIFGETVRLKNEIFNSLPSSSVSLYWTLKSIMYVHLPSIAPRTLSPWFPILITWELFSKYLTTLKISSVILGVFWNKILTCSTVLLIL